MNRFLYKYMPLRLGFFDEPMVRATPVRALNDPFEARFNGDQVKDADKHHREYYRGKVEDVDEIDDWMLNELVGSIQMDICGLGVISFTEDFNNPLMWAHYADEHRGIVVEFDFNEPFFMDSLKVLNGRLSRFGEDYFGELFEFPEKVNYRREMPDFSRPELSAPDNMSEFHWRKFNRTVLFTKSNDWIYEKEHRSIVKLKDADSIICNDSEDVRKQCKKDPSIELLELEGGKIQVVFPLEYEMHEEMGDESIKNEIFFLTNDLENPAIHLFRINPKAISGVYFGFDSDFREGLREIKNSKFFTNLHQLFRMKIDSKLYKLNKVLLE